MIVVSGATGHIGSRLVRELIAKNQEVTGITGNPERADNIREAGAMAAVVDIYDTSGLRELINKAEKFYLLNPPADISKNPSQEERQSVQVLIDAVKNSRLKKIVAASTYGAQPGEELGDLGALYELEQKLLKTNVPHEIIRGAYYYSNWDMSLESAKAQGKIYSFFPKDFKLPMVAPADIATLAAQRLIADESIGMHHIEGPQHYSPNDVADAFSTALGKSVEVVEIPRESWETSMQQVGFSEAAARSMSNMTQATIDGLEMPVNPVRGNTALQDYIDDLVRSGKDSE